MDIKCDFETYWASVNAGAIFEDRKEAAREAWNQNPQKQVPIIRWLKKHGAYPGRNPYFFILDFKVRQRQGQPEFLRGDEGGDLVQVKYNGLFKICTRETAKEFNLEIIKTW